MKLGIFLTALFVTLTTTISGQFVGDGAPKTTSAPAPSDKPKVAFTLKFGLAIPLSNYGTTPARTNIPQYSSGVMGAKTGFFAETGFGINFVKPEKKVGFYYFPIMVAYWKTSLDWSSLGGFFADKAIYTKPVSVIDIGQRYGIVVKPMKDVSVALYYRPGLIIPLDFEINHKNTAAGETFLFSGTMSTADNAPLFMLSNTPGISVQYKIAVISLEGYFAKPTYDVIYTDIDTSPVMNVNVATTGKIPVKMFLLSLALSF
jgi:hypothetical protein